MSPLLAIEFDNDSDIPLWVQLRNRIIYLIHSGHFKPGDRLPTVRELASQVSINYNTVNKAYLNLMNDGYITSIRGKGAFVNDISMEENEEHNEELFKVLDDCISMCKGLGLSNREIESTLSQKLRELKLEQEKADIIPR